ATGGRAVVEPGDLGKALPLVIDEIVVFDAAACLEDDDIDALLGEFVAKRATTGARADDDDNAVVVELILGCHYFLPGNETIAIEPPAPAEARLTSMSKPFDFIEPAFDVASLRIGRSLIPEERPDLLLVIEAGDKVASHGLEERAVLNVAENGDAIILPVEPAIASRTRTAVQVGNAILDHGLIGRIAAGLGIMAFDGDGVIPVRQLIVRIGITRHPDQRLHRLRLEIVGIISL